MQCNALYLHVNGNKFILVTWRKLEVGVVFFGFLSFWENHRQPLVPAELEGWPSTQQLKKYTDDDVSWKNWEMSKVAYSFQAEPWGDSCGKFSCVGEELLLCFSLVGLVDISLLAFRAKCLGALPFGESLKIWCAGCGV